MNVTANIRPGKTSKRDLRYAIQTDFANSRRREATGCPGTTEDAEDLILRGFARRFSRACFIAAAKRHQASFGSSSAGRFHCRGLRVQFASTADDGE